MYILILDLGRSYRSLNNFLLHLLQVWSFYSCLLIAISLHTYYWDKRMMFCSWSTKRFMETWLHGSERRLSKLWWRGTNLCLYFFCSDINLIQILWLWVWCCVGFCVCEIWTFKPIIGSQSRLSCLWMLLGLLEFRTKVEVIVYIPSSLYLLHGFSFTYRTPTAVLYMWTNHYLR